MAPRKDPISAGRESQSLRPPGEAQAPLYQQLYERLRSSILDGWLAPGARLPSSRSLVAELGVSRNTVVNAFEQLTAEGYLEGRRGAGTYVAAEIPEEMLAQPGDAADPRPAPPTRLSRRGLDLLETVPTPPSPAVPAIDNAFQLGLPALDRLLTVRVLVDPGDPVWLENPRATPGPTALSVPARRRSCRCRSMARAST